jgi:hypothetical protein
MDCTLREPLEAHLARLLLPIPTYLTYPLYSPVKGPLKGKIRQRATAAAEAAKPPEHGTGFRQMINTVYSTMLWLLRLGLVHINRVADRHRAE